MLTRFVFVDLFRNPRRTLSTMIGVLLGVGLFTSILIFVDGLSASMTQRAIAPLPIDMQRILTEPVAGNLSLKLDIEPADRVAAGQKVEVRLTFENLGQTPANEVSIRSALPAGFAFVPGSALTDGTSVPGDTNPFAQGETGAGLNLGTIAAGHQVAISYWAKAVGQSALSTEAITATFSTREALIPIAANSDNWTSLTELARQIAAVDGVAYAEPLALADLAPGGLSAGTAVSGQARVFGFSTAYADHDPTIVLTQGAFVPGSAVVSAETASALSAKIGDSVTVNLPNGSSHAFVVSGIADLTKARALFASRRGSDLETFIYTPNAAIIDSASFAEVVLPAFAEAASTRGTQVLSPPIREVDIGVHRDRLSGDPETALVETTRIANAIRAVAERQDFLLDNVSNTLAVASVDAGIAKRMFVLLGLPGAMLSAFLASYAGFVLGGAQRQERAILRIRGATRGNLLAMLALRVSCIAAAGALVGVVLGYASAAGILGAETLIRVRGGRLVVSAMIGSLLGLLAAGGALYLSGRRTIDREINEDRAAIYLRAPAWWHYRLDLFAQLLVAIATAAALAYSAFEGTPGSVYVGRPVVLNLWLLGLPIGLWVAGALFGGRIIAAMLERIPVTSEALCDRPHALIIMMSLRRRLWDICEAAIIICLIVGLAVSLAVFSASYDIAKRADAAYVLGGDLRITPAPDSNNAADKTGLADIGRTGLAASAAVNYGVHNAVVRSARTEELVNLAATDPGEFAATAPLDDAAFPSGSAKETLDTLAEAPDGILLSREMAGFLKARVGDALHLILARGTPQQAEVNLRLVGLFDHLPGFAEGIDALMPSAIYRETVVNSSPDFFLLRLVDPSDAALDAAIRSLSLSDATLSTRRTTLLRDQSSLAALNIGGLVAIDSGFSMAMGAATVAIFVFGLLLQRRREYVTLRALGMGPASIRWVVSTEIAVAVIVGCLSGIPLGLGIAVYFVRILRPLFILQPPIAVPFDGIAVIIGVIVVAATLTALSAVTLITRLRAAQLLRED